MHKVLEWVKTHPKTAGAILVGLVLLLFLMLRGGSSNAGTAAVVTAQPTNTAQNTALQEAMINAQVATNATLAQAGVQNNAIAASQALGTLQSNNATQVALANIATTADTTKFVSNLNAQVENNKTDAAKSINDAQMSAATQIATINANASEALGQLAAGMNADNNATNISLAGITAGVLHDQNAAALALGTQKQNFDYSLGLNQIEMQGQLGSQQISADQQVKNATLATQLAAAMASINSNERIAANNNNLAYLQGNQAITLKMVGG